MPPTPTGRLSSYVFSFPDGSLFVLPLSHSLPIFSLRLPAYTLSPVLSLYYPSRVLLLNSLISIPFFFFYNLPSIYLLYSPCRLLLLPSLQSFPFIFLSTSLFLTFFTLHRNLFYPLFHLLPLFSLMLSSSLSYPYFFPFYLFFLFFYLFLSIFFPSYCLPILPPAPFPYTYSFSRNIEGQGKTTRG